MINPKSPVGVRSGVDLVTLEYFSKLGNKIIQNSILRL